MVPIGSVPVMVADTMGGGAAGLWNVTPVTYGGPVNIPVIPDSPDILTAALTPVKLLGMQ